VALPTDGQFATESEERPSGRASAKTVLRGSQSPFGQVRTSGAAMVVLSTEIHSHRGSD
jgi:hypothetical protein